VGGGRDRNREIKKYYCGKEKKKVKYMKGDDKMKRDILLLAKHF
jgi:hypothetical protein